MIQLGKNRERNRRFLMGMLLFTGLIYFSACKKPEDRLCFKSTGEFGEFVIDLDSVRHFDLGENVKYRIFQDSTNRVIIKGGSNLIKHIDISNRDNVLYVRNLNKCKFVRNSPDQVEVEIHYPSMNGFTINMSDSVIFMNQIKTHTFRVLMRDGGGSLVANVDVTKISMIVANGAGDFTLSGKADEAELKIQNNGAANASAFRSEYVFIYQNSTANMFIDLNGSSASILVDGTGNVFYSNEAGNIESEIRGEGQIIKL